MFAETSSPVGAPWELPDWWNIRQGGRNVDLPVSLLGCQDLDAGSDWSCVQSGGPGGDIAVTIESLDPLDNLPGGVASSSPIVVGRLQIDLWVPEDKLRARSVDATFTNCFATLAGQANRSLWEPEDARGLPNLGGLAEPPGNNCSFAVLSVPTPTSPPPPRRPQPPRRPGPGRPAPTATPWAIVTKNYKPQTKGQAVTEGSEFQAEVRMQIRGVGGEAQKVFACDKWDNSTHTLRDAGASGVDVFWQAPGQAAGPPPADKRYVVEYATGRWGSERSNRINVGRAWYAQASASCDDTAPSTRAGWVQAHQLDFSSSGQKSDGRRRCKHGACALYRSYSYRYGGMDGLAF